MYASNIFTSALLFAAGVFAYPALEMRASTTVDPTAVTGTVCGDTTEYAFLSRQPTLQD